MKAFLLAGGLGTRLKPLTNTTPKCLLPIQGVPMMQIWFDLCRRYGITDVLVNIHCHADAVRKFVQENKSGLKVLLFEEPSLLGSAGTILANRDWIGGEAPFWVLYSDVLTTTNLSDMLLFHNRCRQLATIGVYKVKDPSRCGVVQVNDEHIVCDFVEKPKVPISNLAFSGVMLATPALVDLIPIKNPTDLGFHVLPQIVGRMAAYPVGDFLMDIGTLENYRIAQKIWPGFSHSPKSV